MCFFCGRLFEQDKLEAAKRFSNVCGPSMPRKSPDKYLLDMVLAGQKIRRFLTGYDKQRFVADEKTISAVERQFEI